MDSTSVNLLRRLSEPDAELAWERFIELYTPLMFFWARKRGLSVTDASDLVQDILLTVFQRIGEFDPEGSGRFRGWLRTITVNRANDFYRRRQRGMKVVDIVLHTPAIDPNAELWEETQYRQHLISRKLDDLREEFQSSTWIAAYSQIVEGKAATEVAESLGMTLNAVYVAKSRVLSRLREALRGLLD